MTSQGRHMGGIRLNVFQRIAAGYGMILLILLGTAVVTFVRANQLRTQIQDFAREEVPALHNLGDLTGEIYVEELAITHYLDSPLTGPARDDLLAPYFQTKVAVHTDVGLIQDFAAINPWLKSPLADLKVAIVAREAQADQNIALVRAGKPPEVVPADHYSLVDAIQGAAEQLSSAIETHVDQDAAAAGANAATGLLLICGLFLLGVALTVVAGVWSARSISRPLALLTRSAERIAGGESLDPPQLDRSDEIGTLAVAVGQMVRSLREITEKERVVAAEHKLIGEELKRSNSELEQFAYIASHDLQEPLRMVGSYTGLLKRRYRGKLDAEADEFIDYAMDGVNRMRALINDLLSYSRLGREERTLEPTDSRAALDRALANLDASIKERGALVTIGQLPTVLGNFSQLTQLFQNLVGNGLKFSKQNQPEIRVDAEASGADWIFSVRDNGIGIDPQYRDRIFLIFQRLHKRDEYEGTGIGLAICRKVVEQHGGRIWVESEPGKGATFRFTLRAMDRLERAA